MICNLKVLHVLEASLPAVGGYSIRAKYIVENQFEMNIVPTIVTAANYKRDKDDLINNIHYYRSYISLSGVRKNIYKIPFLKEIFTIYLLKKKIKNIIDKDSVNIIHAHSPSLCGIPAMMVAKERNIPFIYEVRALWEDAAVDRKRFSEHSFKYNISRMLENQIFNKAESIVCICNGLKNEIEMRAKRHDISVIKNGVDTKIFKPQHKPDDLVYKYNANDSIVIGFIGSFFTFEGISTLIKAVPDVISQNKTIKFIIVGGGVEENNLHDLAKNLGVYDTNLFFTGRVPHESVNDYYALMDILVYPRNRLRITEMVTPLKPLEAMAMEKTVLASNVGGLKELVEDGRTGRLFTADDSSDLAQKILELADNEAERIRLGKNARQDVIDNREWKKIVHGYLPIYRNLIKTQ